MFQEINDGKVLMGNDGTCSIVGKSTMQIIMSDGFERILTNVRYVAKLLKNLV